MENDWARKSGAESGADIMLLMEGGRRISGGGDDV